MKTIVDFLKEKRKYQCKIIEHNLVFELQEENILLTVDDENWLFKDGTGEDHEFCIQDVLSNVYNIEIRFCEECGKPYDVGYTACSGEWYCCEECFESTMNKDYGKKKWRPTDEEGKYGGLYEYLNTDGEWEDTGIYWTEWN